MVRSMDEAAFRDLRRLADWLAGDAPAASATLARLGRTAVPLLGRALRGDDARRREAARRGLAQLAQPTSDARARVLVELHAIVVDATIADDAKVCAVGLLAE